MTKQIKHRDEIPFNLTVHEFAEIMRISPAKAYDFLRKNKDLPRIKIGSKIVVPKEGFLQWLQQEGDYKASQETLRMCVPEKREKSDKPVVQWGINEKRVAKP